VKVGDVLKKERSGNGLSCVGPISIAEMSNHLGVDAREYERLESGEDDIEHWFPLLCRIAVELETPVACFVSDTGLSDDARSGVVGSAIRDRREAEGRTVEMMSEALGVEVAQYVSIEKCNSPIETYGPLVLRFAERIDQPMFNLFMPCGVPCDELDDYP